MKMNAEDVFNAKLSVHNVGNGYFQLNMIITGVLIISMPMHLNIQDFRFDKRKECLKTNSLMMKWGPSYKIRVLKWARIVRT